MTMPIADTSVIDAALKLKTAEIEELERQKRDAIAAVRGEVLAKIREAIEMVRAAEKPAVDADAELAALMGETPSA